MVSWDDAKLEDTRVDQFVQALRQGSEFKNYFNSVISTTELVQTLSQPPLKLSRNQAAGRLQGTMIGRDGTVCVVVMVNEQGVAEHAASVECVRAAADLVPNLGRQALRFVGTVYESYAVDQAAEQSLSCLVLPSTVAGLMISWICVGSLRAVCAVMIPAVAGQLIAIAVVFYGGYQFSAVLIVLPTLIFMLTLSGAVHLVNYFLESAGHSDSGSAFEALRAGWRPCALSSATTMLGMASLWWSELAPVRQFGCLSAICLALSTAMLLVTFPAIVQLVFGLKFRLLTGGHKDSAADDSSPKRCLSFSQSWMDRYQLFIQRHAIAISIGAVLFLAAAAAGLLKLRSSTKFCDMFPTYHKTHLDMLWFEQHIAPIATIEVLLSFPRTAHENLLEEARSVGLLMDHYQSMNLIGGTLSAVSFMPRITEASGVRATAQRAAQKRNIEANVQRLRQEGLLYQTTTDTIWRISCRVSAVSSASYGAMTAEVKEQTDLVTRDLEVKPTVILTGLSPVMHETQITLLSDLGYSFLSAYLLITPIMMWIMRSWFGGLLIMIPNVLPIAMAFGSMGWIGASLDIAGILTASVALGIAVDDTLHFVCWYQRRMKLGDNSAQAVRCSLNACSSAMLHTSLICCCSMFPFLFARFVPTQQFAQLMIFILMSALAADLITLPALLLCRPAIFSRTHRERKLDEPLV